VPRDWSELLITAEPLTASGDQKRERRGLFSRLREGMARTREALGSEIQATFQGELDAAAWERLEEALIMADVGAPATARIVGELEAEAAGKDGQQLTERLVELLAQAADVGEPRIDLRERPTVIMNVGVNGTGKTTSAGKLAWHLQREAGSRVLLAAADTFRAAAREQLEGWAERAGCAIVTGADGADPGSVAFDAVARARSDEFDVLVIDTAGRLHTREDLMAELGKIRDVVARQLPDAPHETLLTIDATTGQNGLRQAREFASVTEVSGVILTKLDGTARGGIAIAIAQELGIPVKLVGVGESVEDLRPFDAVEFARALIADS
jgi:fused signal recognition particle receptor